MPKYEVRLNLKPTIHDGCMQYYWQVLLINNDGVFTIKNGWNEFLPIAMLNAACIASQLGW